MAEMLGDWTLKFTVDGSGLESATSGVQHLESSMQEASNKSKGFANELKGIKQDLSGLGSSFMLLGAAAGGTLGGLAALAPSLAGNLANLKIGLMGVGEAFAPHIAPIIDGITNQLNGFANWLQQNPGATQFLTETLFALGGLGVVGLVLKIGESVAGTLHKLWNIASWLTGGKLNEWALNVKGTIAENLHGFWTWAKGGIVSIATKIEGALSGALSGIFSMGAKGLLYTGLAIAIPITLAWGVAEGFNKLNEMASNPMQAGWYLYGEGENMRLEQKTAMRRQTDLAAQSMFGGEQGMFVAPWASSQKEAEESWMQMQFQHPELSYAKNRGIYAGANPNLNPFEQMKQMAQGQGGATTNNININVEGSITSEGQFFEKMSRMLRQAQVQYG